MNQRILGLPLRVWGAFFGAWFLFALYLSYRKTDFSVMTVVEIVAVITGALCVWLAIIENIWNWAVGIVSSAAFGVVFYSAKLPSDMGLQVVYIVLGFIGWYNWLYGGRNRTELTVRRTPKWEWGVLAAAGVLGTLALLWINQRFKGASPFWDAFTTAFSLVAQYMITRKYLENWFVWIVVDLIYIPLYISRHLYPTAVLYALFTCMALLGWQEWRQSLTKGQESSLLDYPNVGLPKDA